MLLVAHIFPDQMDSQYEDHLHHLFVHCSHFLRHLKRTTAHLAHVKIKTPVLMFAHIFPGCLDVLEYAQLRTSRHIGINIPRLLLVHIVLLRLLSALNEYHYIHAHILVSIHLFFVCAHRFAQAAQCAERVPLHTCTHLGEHSLILRMCTSFCSGHLAVLRESWNPCTRVSACSHFPGTIQFLNMPIAHTSSSSRQRGVSICSEGLTYMCTRFQIRPRMHMHIQECLHA